jgi:hypothetical protein
MESNQDARNFAKSDLKEPSCIELFLQSQENNQNEQQHLLNRLNRALNRFKREGETGMTEADGMIKAEPDYNKRLCDLSSQLIGNNQQLKELVEKAEAIF